MRFVGCLWAVVLTAVISSPALCYEAKEADQHLPLTQEVSHIRYAVTAISHEYSDHQSRIDQISRIVDRSDSLIKLYPEYHEPYLWKGISLAAEARERGAGFRALSAIAEAKENLLKSIEIEPNGSGAAAYNALGMLYAKAPGWPISFGSKQKAREHFELAIKKSRNIDTCYRYGEYLIHEGEKQKGLAYLEAAFSLENRPGRKEDLYKKKEIASLIKKARDRN